MLLLGGSKDLPFPNPSATRRPGSTGSSLLFTANLSRAILFEKG